MLDYLDLGSLRLHDAHALVPFALSSVQGLTGLPGVRGDAFDRPDEDGGVDPIAAYLPARVVILEGEVWATTPGLSYDAAVASAWASFDTFAAALEATKNTAALMKWKRLGGTIDKQTSVRLAGDIQPTLSNDGPILTFQVQLRAADPRHYSVVEHASQVLAPTGLGALSFAVTFPATFGTSAGGSIAITNAGNTKTWPRITIQGPIAGPVIQNVSQGASLYFDGLALGAADVLTIDMNPANRFATVNGVNALGYLRWASSSFFSISGNASDTLAFFGLNGGYAGTTQMTVAWRDAYTT